MKKTKDTIKEAKPNKNSEVQSTKAVIPSYYTEEKRILRLFLHMIERGYLKPTEKQEQILRKKYKDWWFEYEIEKTNTIQRWERLKKAYGKGIPFTIKKAKPKQFRNHLVLNNETEP